MSKRFHIFHQSVLLLWMAAVLLTACSSDNTPEAQTVPTVEVPVDHVVHLQTFASDYQETPSAHRAAPEGYADYALNQVTDMGIYMLLPEDYAAPTEQLIKYDGAKWHAYFNVVKDKTYAVYGYLPKIEGVSSTLTKTTADEATLTITGMKPITTDDICIITGVKETDEGLREGNLSWKQVVKGDDYHIYMLLNHLYASVRFSIKVDAGFAQLRTIKLKSMKLQTTQSSVSAAVSLTHNTTGAVPITGVVYTATGSSSEAVFFTDDEGEALSAATAKVFDTCFVPTLSNNLTLVSTYDVYDRYGNLIRANCKATNKIPDLEASRGQRVQLNLTVNPSYLYVLSDKDLDDLFKIED